MRLRNYPFRLDSARRVLICSETEAAIWAFLICAAACGLFLGIASHL